MRSTCRAGRRPPRTRRTATRRTCARFCPPRSPCAGTPRASCAGPAGRIHPRSSSCILLQLLHDRMLVHEGLIRGTNLERTHADAGMAAHDPDGIVLVLRLEDQDAAEHFLRLGERAVDQRRLAALPADRRRGGRVLEREAPGEVPLRIQLLVEVRAGLDHCLLLLRAQLGPCLLVERTEADELHDSLSAPDIPISRNLSSVSLSPKSSSSNIRRTSISQSEPSSVGFGNFFVHSTASSRDFTLMIV